MSDTFRFICPGDYDPNDTGNPHVEQAKHYMLTYVTQVITAAQIAEHVGLSQYHLSRLFKSLTGRTMMDYLTDQQIEAAKQLLTTTNQSIHEIAALLRFCDQSHMTYAFRKRTGMTPGQHRDKTSQNSNIAASNAIRAELQKACW